VLALTKMRAESGDTDEVGNDHEQVGPVESHLVFKSLSPSVSQSSVEGRRPLATERMKD
jgi:hypothetical protein